MANITIPVDDELRLKMEKYPWVNWSEVARSAVFEQYALYGAIQRYNELLKDSELTEDVAFELGEAAKQRMRG